MEKIKSLSKTQKLAWLLTLLPIICLVGLLYLKTVNVPFWDEWELVPIFQHLHAGHFWWSDFWMQHNEHRLLFPNLILVGLAYVTRWNVRIESFISVLVAILSFGILLRLLVTMGHKSKQAIPLFLPLLLAVIWFSPVQIENWQWGWQLEWFLNILGVTLVAYAISKLKNSSLSYKALSLILAGGILAQYSLGNGTLIWPIVVALLIYLRLPLKQILTVAVTGVVTTFLYYWHYTNPGEPSKSLFLKQPFQFVKYFFIYLGRPLSFMHKTTALLGLLLFVSFISLSIYLLVYKRDAFKRVVPFVFLGLYALGSAFITDLARLGFGTVEAYSSRYTTISSLLLISVLVLFWASADELKFLKHRRYLYTTAALVVSLLVCVNVAWGVHSASEQYQKLTTTKACTHLTQPTTSCLLTAYPNAQIVSGRLEYIKSIHWGGY